MFYTIHSLPQFNQIFLKSDGESLTGLWLEGQKYHGGKAMTPCTHSNDLPIFTETKLWLDHYFNSKNPSINDLPLAPVGTPFRTAVWEILCEIPYGEVLTYGAIAKEIALRLNKDNMSAQAVGGAVGHNPISIIIPCHRVVGTKGNLTGYAGGLSKKVALLEHEGVDLSKFFVPSSGTAL